MAENRSRKMRIIGKIRGYAEKEAESLGKGLEPWIAVKKRVENCDRSTIVFNAPSSRCKYAYELDGVYGQDDGTDVIYSRDVKPLVLGAFDGQSASFIALGAKGSGKTHITQGTREKPGLVVLAMLEILEKAAEVDKLVSMSIYEIVQDHAYDLLNSDHHEVLVLEDGQGKVKLKGLSQVPVRSISEFCNIYFCQRRKLSKAQPLSHKGLMVNISSKDCSLESKINFVDLSGYEDSRRSLKDGITPSERTRINRPLYALLNVIAAMRADEIHVPYRESKLTRILQDTLGGISHVLLLTCINPYFCQDTVSLFSLVSRSFHINKKVLTDTTNTSQNSAKLMNLSASRNRAAKKAGCFSMGSEEQKYSCKQVKILESGVASASMLKKLPNIDVEIIPFSLEESVPQEKAMSDCSSTQENTEDLCLKNSESESITRLQDSCSPKSKLDQTVSIAFTSPSQNVSLSSGTTDLNGVVVYVGSNTKDQVDFVSTNMQDVSVNVDTYQQDDRSPPLSQRIREVCNNLKSMCASASASTSTPMISVHEVPVTPNNNNVEHNSFIEPKTPCAEQGSLSGTFRERSTSVKNTLVRQYLHFLNSATKEELKSLKGIGEKRASDILRLREESPEPFKTLDDLREIKLSAKQIKGMMKQATADLFS